MIIKEIPEKTLPKSAGRRSSNAAGRQREEIPSGGAPLSRLRPQCLAVPCLAVGGLLPCQPPRCCSAVASWKRRAGSLALPNPLTNGGGKRPGFAANTTQNRLVSICIEEPQSLAHLCRAAIMFCKNVTSRSS